MKTSAPLDSLEPPACLAFLMSVIAVSLPEAMILRNVLKPPLIAAFFGILALSIVFVGYLFNLLM